MAERKSSAGPFLSVNGWVGVEGTFAGFELSRRKSPSDLGELVGPVFQAADYRSLVGRPNVIARYQARDRIRPFHGNAGLAERGEVLAVGDVVADIVAHCRCSSTESGRNQPADLVQINGNARAERVGGRNRLARVLRPDCVPGSGNGRGMVALALNPTA